MMSNKEQVFWVIVLSIIIIPILITMNANIYFDQYKLEPSKSEEITNDVRHYQINSSRPYIMYFNFDEYQIKNGSTLIFNWTMERGRFTVKQNGVNILMSEINGSIAFQPQNRNRLMLDCMMFNWFVEITIILPLEQ